MMIYTIKLQQENDDGFTAICIDDASGQEVLSAYHPDSQLQAFSDLLDMMQEELA